MQRHVFWFVLLFLSVSACQDYKVVAVKDFRIYAETKDPALQHSIEVLANRYNREIGSKALTIVRTPEESNSRIRFVAGLHNDGHKLGLGQWITTKREQTSLSLQGQSSVQTVAYAMDIEFDLENFKEKASNVDVSTSAEALHLYHLFCHEIGHGLQMDHSGELQSVMYPTIPDQPNRYVNYKSYFNQARSFMSSH